MIAPRPKDAVLHQEVRLSKLLLAEGETPTHFFEALSKHLGIADQIEIRNYGGISQLALFLRTIAATAGFRGNVKSLGIVRDAEDNHAGAASSVQAAIIGATLPKTLKVTPFILPNNAGSGMIETLCMQSVRGLPVFECVEKFIECARGKGISFPTGVILAKHEAQIYLSTQEKCQMMPGIAAYHGAWQFGDPTFNEIKAFLQNL